MIDRRFIYRSEVGSSNEEALRLGLLGGASNGTILLAGFQNAGRGKSGRQWTSPFGNLYMSLLFDGSYLLPDDFTYLGAVALGKALCAIFGDQFASSIEYKKPNDLLIGGKKIAGVLPEAVTVGDKSVWVLGIGLNTCVSPIESAGNLNCDIDSIYEKNKLIAAGTAHHFEKLLIAARNVGTVSLLEELNLAKVFLSSSSYKVL